MSEYINNREYKQKVLKDVIKQLHNGKSVEEVKEQFASLIEGISAAEISEMEQSLIMEGMPIEEIQRLCDVHASVFKGSIEEIHRPQNEEDMPGHPVHTFKLENREIERTIENIKKHVNAYEADNTSEHRKLLEDSLNLLSEVDKHYLRKENLIFPYMERYEITAPPKVMWGVDDEIRALIKEAKRMLLADEDTKKVSEKIIEAANKAGEMVFKEENIMIPMILEIFTEDEWKKIAYESDEIGYTLIQPKGKWNPVKVNVVEKEQEKGTVPANNGFINFDTGVMTPDEISAVLNTMPVDLTFVDKDGVVKYFSQAKDRIFPRTKAIIGRQVQNCHPPASVHIVEKIVEDLKAGKKDSEDFWIRMGGKYVYIRYFAVRNEMNEFLGVLEVTQDIKPIQDITGEKRLAD